MRIANKYINKNKITLIDTTFSLEYSTDDTNQCQTQRIYDKKRENLIKIKIPKKKIIDSIGIKCNFALFITDVKIFQTSYYVPIFIPLPGAYIAGHATGPALGINGNYILWDYDRECAICAGNFKKNFMTSNIGDNNDMERLNSIIVGVLNKTPFWKIHQQYQS
jgi:hypothetical protein